MLSLTIVYFMLQIVSRREESCNKAFYSYPLTNNKPLSSRLSRQIPIVGNADLYYPNINLTLKNSSPLNQYVHGNIQMTIFSFLLSFFLSSFFLFRFLFIMTTIPSFGHDTNHDVHAPASTYYTTGDNARLRTRTYTVHKIDLNFPL